MASRAAFASLVIAFDTEAAAVIPEASASLLAQLGL